jgi:hypothetical protein
MVSKASFEGYMHEKKEQKRRRRVDFVNKI